VFVYEEFYGEYNSKIHAIHHNDFNCLNDSPENLILKTWKEHRNFHSELNKGDRNVMKRPEMRKYFSNLMMGNKRALGSIRDAEFRKKLSINNGMKKKEVSERVAEKLRNKPKSQEHIDKLRVAAFLAMQRPDVKKNYIDGMKNRVSLSGEKNGMFGVHRFGENNPNYKHGRYCSNHKVVSVEFCGMEEVFDIETVDEFHNFAAEGIFIHNCFVLPVDDSIHSIFDAIRNMAVIFQRGGGCGFNFSALRPKDAPLSSGGTSSGSTSFMNLFDRVTEIVKQGGFRRGAAMSVLNYNHPDILDFCRSKLTRTLTNFNLSVLVTDEFMASLENGGMYVDLMHEGKKYGSLKSKDIFDLITLGAWVSGDPGLLFYDRINKDNKRFPEIKIIATNPCGEVPLPDWGACTLGSINISKFVDGDNFDFDKFYDIVKIGSRALLNVNLINYYPIPQIGKVMQELSPFGVGIMGFADALIMLGIKYDSEDSLDFIRKLAKPYVEASDEVGGDSFYKRSIAPTGSLSILADCSSGIEPVFDTSFERHITVGVVTETRDIYKSEFCRTAHQVSPDWHIKIQTEFQKFVDAGVSKTVNVPYDIGVEDIRNIYLQAWKRGAKGITVFRDKSIPGVLVSTSKCDGESCIL
jgi:ribonucleotide reductase alpha subunit